MKRVKQIFAGLLFAALTAWGVMALAYSNLPYRLRLAAAAAFIIAVLLGIIIPRSNTRKIVWYSGVFALLLAWWLLLPPSNNRDWAPDVATLPYAEIGGSSVTIHNIRNCAYRTEKDYEVRHYDRTFNLAALRTMDLYLVNWGLPHFSHAMISFGFGGGEYVCLSIETRKKKGEKYSSLKGFFKQYELTYVVADERDVVRLRTDYRIGEEVWLYRLKATPELARLVFLDYLASVNRLKDRPQWYNALTASCTTSVRKHIAPYYPKFRFDWRILASGHADQLVYEMGVVDTTLPLRELKLRSRINARSKAAGQGPGYSEIIRRGLPGFD